LRKESLTIPEITEADREAGFMKWPVTFYDGHTDVLTVYRPDPVVMFAIIKMDTMTRKVYTMVACALREEMAFVAGITGRCITELFFVANGLVSEEVLRKALLASKEIGQGMIQETLPGGSENPGDN
jgi:hypothetical protein